VLPRGGRYAVAILALLNLFNYLDRYVPSSVKDLFKADLHLTDTQTSLPLSAFVVVYMLMSPVFGSLAEKLPRKWLISAGVALWSVATGAASLATGFWTLLFTRALVGVGEAAYATLSPPLISDFYPPDRRNRVLTFFFIAIPVGAALGFLLGGKVGAAYGWRAAFLVAGAPGLVLAGLALLIREPGRGLLDPGPTEPVANWALAVRALSRNRLYIFAVAGYTAVTFASGAMADWFPTFLSRHRGMPLAQADLLVGSSAVVGGLFGTAAGGFCADLLKRFSKSPYLLLCSASMVLAVGGVVLTLTARESWAVAASIYAAQFFLWFYNGPVNTVLVNSVSPGLRVRAFALSILSIHLLGDAVSPSVVGWLSDHGGLERAMWLIPLALAAGVAFWVFGAIAPRSPTANAVS
jgi:MFS family permease